MTPKDLTELVDRAFCLVDVDRNATTGRPGLAYQKFVDCVSIFAGYAPDGQLTDLYVHVGRQLAVVWCPISEPPRLVSSHSDELAAIALSVLRHHMVLDDLART